MASTRFAAGLICIACGVALALPAAAGASTITPNETGDDFDAVGAPDTCSLREAIQNAVTNTAANGCATAGESGTDTIVLNAGPADSYTIDIGANGNETNTEDDFDVAGGGPIVIRGTAGAVIDTLATDRIFDVKNGADLTLQTLTVQNGDVTSALTTEGQRGGNIRANSTSELTLDGVTVRLGDSREGGGGVYSGTSNQLTIIDSSVSTNQDARRGGGLFVLANSEPVQITRSLIILNDAFTDDDGVGLLQGGGISFSGEQMTIEDSEVSYNSATHDGTAGGDGASGGGIRSGSDITIRRSLIRNNTVVAANGSEEAGGAIMAEGGTDSETISVVNSTIHGNSAGTDLNEGDGGAIFTKNDADPDDDVDVSLAHVTFSNNSTNDVISGDQVQTGTASDAGSITIRASILPGFSGIVHNPCAGTKVISAGFNVAQQDDPDCNFGASDSTAATATGTVGVDPVDNGGATDTFALQLGGRAAGFVPAAQCGPAEGTDQRGYPRPLPLGGACDAGAYELHSCDGTTILNGPFAACPVAPQPSVPAKKTKCKKKKKKKGKAAAGAKKKKCKKKKKK